MWRWGEWIWLAGPSGLHQNSRPPLWARRLHARLSCSGPGFDPWSGEVSWVRFFQGFSSPVRQMSGSFRPPKSPNIIWPSSSSPLTIHYGCQWPEMLMRPKTLTLIVPRAWYIGFTHPFINCQEKSDTHFVYFWSLKTLPYTHLEAI